MNGKWNSNQLKAIAIGAMTIDHLADLFWPGFPAEGIAVICHVIGRLTAPIMWFFICEGFFYTKNIRKYVSRMFFFALLSHGAYCFAFGIDPIPFRDGVFNQTSVMWSLAWSVAALWAFYGDNRWKTWQKWLALAVINLIAFPADYSSIAVMAILFMYEHRGDLKKQMGVMLFWVLIYGLVSFLFVNRVYALVHVGVILVWPLLGNYSGERGRAKWSGTFFYLYYPAHLVVLGILRLWLYGDVPLLF